MRVALIEQACGGGQQHHRRNAGVHVLDTPHSTPCSQLMKQLELIPSNGETDKKVLGVEILQ